MRPEQNISELKTAFLRIKSRILQSFGLSLAVIILSLAPVAYMRDVYGPILNSRSLYTLAMVTTLLAFAMVISFSLGYARSRILATASNKLASDLAIRIFSASLRGNLNKHPDAKTAVNDFDIIRTFITSTAMIALQEAPLGIIFLILVFLIHPYMGIMATLAAIIILIMAIFVEKKVRPSLQKGRNAYQKAMSIVADSAKNSQVIAAMRMQSAIHEKWSTAQNLFLKEQASASILQSRFSSASKFVMFSQASLVLGAGTLLLLTGHLSADAGAYLIISKILASKALGPVVQLIGSWKNVSGAIEAYNRLEQFLEDEVDPASKMKLPRPKGVLTIDHAVIRPPGVRMPILSGVTFAVKPGQVVGLIGPSGSGKSSLIRSIVGLWQPIQGHIRLDGAELASWNKIELGPAIGYLPQDIELFDGSIAENISRFDIPDPVALEKAINMAGLKSVIEDLPSGVDTQIGSGGGILSGGLRQRIALARAVYGDPQLIVLDEPNSNLDEAGNQHLTETIKKLKEQKATIIIVTHRKNILNIIDKLAVFGKGKLLIFGPTESVMEKIKEKQLKYEAK